MKFVQREREIEIDRDREIEIERDRETERDRENCWSYDFIYHKIEEECLIPHLLHKCSWKNIMN